MQLGVVPVEAVAVAVLLEERELGDPVELGGALHRVALEPGQHRLPAGQHVDGLGVGVGAERSSTYLRARSRYSICSCTRGQPAAVAQRHQVAQRRVVGDRPQRRDRRLQREVAVMKRSSIIASTSAVVPTLR